MEEDRKKSEDLLSKAKLEFIDQWTKIKCKCCDDILNNAKNTLYYFFLPMSEKYQKFIEITDFLKEKIYIPECNIINFGLINCTDSIKKIKEDVVPLKCIIPIGNKNNDYKDNLDELLVKEANYIYYNNDKDLSDIYNNVANSIKNITGNQNLEIIYSVLVAHYNDYSEFEKDSNYLEKFIINCLKTKAAFLFFLAKLEAKEMRSTNKKIKEWINQSNLIKVALEENNYELSSELCYNLDMVKDGIEVEMEKLTNYKKKLKKKINEQRKQELKAEYFYKMSDVCNSHSISTDLESIKNAKDEEECRNRLAGSIMDYSILCLNLDKKPKDKQLKDREQTEIFGGIKNILDDVFTNILTEDFGNFMNKLINEKIFELYLSREKLIGEIDLKYDSSIITEEPNGEKIKKKIGEELEILMDKNVKKNILKLVGRFVWSFCFERYCHKFYKLMEKDFEIPENFEEYLLESLNIK